MTSTTARLGGWLLCTPDEWATRTEALSDSLRELIVEYASPTAERGLDVGCQTGLLSARLARTTELTWTGVDPIIATPRRGPDARVALLPGFSNDLPFDADGFDCVVLANVFEHIYPEDRQASLDEIARVLTPGGILVGQLPNPYFPIESHSRLPFMGWLPPALRPRYWRLAPVPWRNDEFPRDTPFYVVTIADLQRCARAAGLDVELVRNFHYPAAALPQALRWTAGAFRRFPLRHLPWAWQFVFRKQCAV